VYFLAVQELLKLEKYDEAERAGDGAEGMKGNGNANGKGKGKASTADLVAVVNGELSRTEVKVTCLKIADG
jgi:hypothetical protein